MSKPKGLKATMESITHEMIENHIPGPWRVVANGTRVHSFEPFRIPIAYVCEVFMSRKAREANAHLIALAPELYKECRRLKDELAAKDGEIEALKGRLRELEERG